MDRDKGKVKSVSASIKRGGESFADSLLFIYLAMYIMLLSPMWLEAVYNIVHCSPSYPTDYPVKQVSLRENNWPKIAPNKHPLHSRDLKQNLVQLLPHKSS